MAFVQLPRGELFYRDSGDGSETVLFSHGLLWSSELYRPQIAHLSDHYRCIAYDHLGQGQSARPSIPAIDIESLTVDTADLIRTLELGPCHFVGLSMGGFVGIRLAARYPELVRSLTLMCTAADCEPKANLARYRLLNAATRLVGTRPVISRIMPIMFGASSLENPELADERRWWQAELAKNDRTIYRAVNGVLHRAPAEDDARRVRVPTMVLRGTDDAAISEERSRALHALIPGSEWVEIPGAGHSATVEQPEAVNAALADFLERHASQPAETVADRR